MKRVLPLFIFVLLSITAFSHTPDTTRHSKVSLNAEFEHFFRDNEFSAEKISGYTLPGFYFRPRVVWNVEKRVHLEAGLHWLHYWGATRYPRNISFTAFPEMGEESAPSHVLPWMQASVDLLPQMTLVFGSLKNDNGHNLARPLYDPELLYAADPEAGIQMLLDFKHFDADIWMDWKEFIFRGSETQERFIFGFSGKSDLFQDALVNLTIPVNVLAQHTGGEMLAQEMDPISVFNFAGGIELTYNLKVRLKTGCDLMGFIHNGNAALPFRQGWGVYPHIGMDFKGLAFDIAYWHGDDFVPLLGSPHFSSISVNTPGLVFDPMDMLVVNASYKMRQFRHTTLTFDALSYIYFPYSGDRPGYPKVERGAAASFSFGFNLKINPLQPLQRKKSLKKAIAMPNF
ncbi:MAG: hypothetical protein J6Z26_05500 [Bacteroidales bacterium]|nr:hypothetical protein [Bacteroidales bacterium]MBP5758472.1 hypothetical protein [Bacteroidales bacterium]